MSRDTGAVGFGRPALWGYVSLGAGLVLMCFSLDAEFILVPPLLMAAFVLGITALNRRAGVAGAFLLLLSLTAPIAVFLARGPAGPAGEQGRAGSAGDEVRAPPQSSQPARNAHQEGGRDSGRERVGARHAGSRPPASAKQPDRSENTRGRLPAPADTESVRRAARAPSVSKGRPRRPPAAAGAAAIGMEAPPTPQDASGAATAAALSQETARGPMGMTAGLANGRYAAGGPPPVDEVRVGGTNAAGPGYSFEGRDMYTDETNMYGTAWVLNEGTNALEEMPLWVMWFDEHTNIIASNRANLVMGNALRPGERRSFGITTPGDPRIAGYQYWVPPPAVTN